MARIRRILKKRTFFLFSRVCVWGGGGDTGNERVGLSK